MATHERIKAAQEALEHQATWASSLARTLVEASGDEPPAWVCQFSHVVGELVDRIDAFLVALHQAAGDGGGTPQVEAIDDGDSLLCVEDVSGRMH